MSDPKTKLQQLVNRATNRTHEDDEEARNAAVLACELIAKNPGLIASAVFSGQGAPKRPDGPSVVHPEAERLRAWRQLKRDKELGEYEYRDEDTTICASCGGTISDGDRVVARSRSDLTTHERCASWWWEYAVPASEEDVGF